MATATKTEAVEPVSKTERVWARDTFWLQPGDVVISPETDADYAWVERTTTTPGKPAEVVLTLTEEEAETLAGIMDRIGGPQNGRRGHADAISAALRSVGHLGGIPDASLERGRDTIYFK